jgi:hypothetical protein
VVRESNQFFGFHRLTGLSGREPQPGSNKINAPLHSLYRPITKKARLYAGLAGNND